MLTVSIHSGHGSPGAEEAPGGAGHRLPDGGRGGACAPAGPHEGGGKTLTAGASAGPWLSVCLHHCPSSYLLQVDTDVCPHRILVSNLPRMDEEMLLNKLEIHFSKKKNGGSEVEACELRRDTWAVVITFVEKGGESVAHQLCSAS